jgi:subtilisin family serine protease
VTDIPGAAKGIAASFGVTVDRTYSYALKGFAAKLPPQALAGISNNPLVDYVEPDIILHASGKPENPPGKPDKPPKPPPSDEEIPWGVDRIDAEKNIGPKGLAVTVAVLDTGIDTDHPELAANYKGGYDFVNSDGSPEDDAGHGTHVSGIIAADDNESGIVGVAPDAGIVAVKVLDSAGSGAISWIIAGIDWVIANKDGYSIEVANMSFGGYGTSDALHTAIQNLYNAGVTIAVSAGNSRMDASYFIPAAYPEVLCTTALTKNGKFASYSNYGSVVDLIAPGSDVKSTYLGGGFAIMSGTSMAAPHVAGSAALWLDDHSGTPAQVMEAIINAGEAPKRGKWPGDPDGIGEPLVDAETL